MIEYNQKLFEHVHGQSDRPSERMQRRMRWVTEHIPAGVKTILDLGAGPGHLSSFLAEHGFEVTSAELVFGSLKRFEGNRVQATCISLPFKNNSFDLVLCAEMIEHLGIRDRELCVGEVRRIAREYV